MMKKICFVCKTTSHENLKTCGNCYSFWYCSRDHQIQDWKRHKYLECIYLSENRDLKKEIKMNHLKPEDFQKYKYLAENCQLSNYSPIYHCFLGYCHKFGIGTIICFVKAYECFKYATERDELTGIIFLALCYRMGEGVLMDNEKALYYYKLAANRGYRPYQYILGCNYCNGQNLMGITVVDYYESHKWMLMAACQGHSEAQHWVGCSYIDGTGVSIDVEEGLKFLKMAADQENIDAILAIANYYKEEKKGDEETYLRWLQFAENIIAKNELANPDLYFRLGLLYIDSTKCETKSILYLQMAIEQGHLEAEYKLGEVIFKTNKTKGIKVFESAAEKGHLLAQVNIATYFLSSDPVDPVKSFHWFSIAANSGDAGAVYSLGNAYMLGNGIGKNLKKGFKLYLKAAKKGLAIAQYNVATCYIMGKGVEVNFHEAEYWLRLACEQNNIHFGVTDAQILLAQLLIDGVEINKNIQEGFNWYKRAADTGDSFAQFNLGLCYLRGDGVEMNKIEAIRMLTLAAEQGMTKAIVQLRCLTKA